MLADPASADVPLDAVHANAAAAILRGKPRRALHILWQPRLPLRRARRPARSYCQLSWKEAGKTVSRLLSADGARLHREWIASLRRLGAALENMTELSCQAGEYILATEGRTFQGPQRPRRRCHSAGSKGH
jgi:hypothetical protein